MFKSIQNKGFQITLNNGVTISVQYGKGNYCERRKEFDYDEDPRETVSKDAEVAAWDKNGVWYTLGFGDTVKGYQSVRQVLRLIDFMRTLTGEEHPDEVEVEL